MWLAPKDLPVARAMRIARRLPGVASVEPDYVRAISAQEPNDPSLLEQYAIAKMQMPQAWEFTTGGSGVVVAVIDSGVQYDHNDLAANMYTNSSEKLDGIDNDGNGYVDDIRGWDFLCGSFSNMGQDNDPADIFGHGTQVAGVIGAVANNAVGITGVAWQVHILPLKIGGDPGLPFLSSVAAIEAIEYAVAQGAKVINASYIGHSYSHFEMEALQAAQDADIIIVAAAGNDSADIDQAPSYPSAYNLANVLSVAATDSLVGFSNFGGKTVDLAAPGYQIYTTTASATPTAPHSHRRKWRASRRSCGRCFPGWACASCG
jgi:subtilisin family serine protease